MPETMEVAVRSMDSTRAAELALLVELEARWENLRQYPAQAHEGTSPAQTLQKLLVIQKAYESFRSKLTAYNQRHKPAHVPELLLNTLARLAPWCRAMQNLYLQVEQDPKIAPPVALLEKGYRYAERISARTGKDGVSRPATPGTVRAAVDGLGVLAQWCDDLAAASATARV